jgi:hypothetical protein
MLDSSTTPTHGATIIAHGDGDGVISAALVALRVAGGLAISQISRSRLVRSPCTSWT